MKPSRTLLLALALLSGCASSYNAYPCGKVPYCYCAPRPLAHADDNACPTCVASKYLAREQVGSDDPGYPSQ